MRTRIIALAVGAAGVAIALFGLPLAVGVLQYALQVQRNELERVAEAVAIQVAEEVAEHEQVTDVRGSHLVRLAVFSHDGLQLGGAPPRSQRELALALAGQVGAGADGDELVVAVPVLHEDEVIGAVRAAVPRSVVWPRVAAIWSGMAALAAIAICAAWLVGRRQARQLARPLEDLAVAARRLGDGDFSVRTRAGGVTEIDSVGAALDSTARRLDDLLVRERAFSADASHQLRTPLAGLRLRLEAALEAPDHGLRAAIMASLGDADRLESTIRELLTLAREQPAVRSAPTDLKMLLREMEPEWREPLARQGRDLVVTADRQVPDPCASAATIRQILSVLADNAATHGAGTVTISLREAPNAVAIDVTDEGPGIDAPASVLFARAADQRNGHGIGLALARRLAEAAGGKLDLAQQSPPTFTLLLPSERPDG